MVNKNARINGDQRCCQVWQRNCGAGRHQDDGQAPVSRLPSEIRREKGSRPPLEVHPRSHPTSGGLITKATNSKGAGRPGYSCGSLASMFCLSTSPRGTRRTERDSPEARVALSREVSNFTISCLTILLAY